MDEHVVHRFLERVRVDALGHREVALRVHVDAQHAVPLLGEGGREVQRRRRLGHAALLVGERDDLGLSFHGGSDTRLLESLPVGIRMAGVDSCMGTTIPAWPPATSHDGPRLPPGRQAGDRHAGRGRRRQDDDLGRAGARARDARREGRGRDDRSGAAARLRARARRALRASRTGSTTRRCAGQGVEMRGRAVGDDARREGDVRRGRRRASRPTSARARRSSRTRSTASSRPRSPARRS